MFRRSIAIIAVLFLLSACYVEVVQSATAIWRISSTDGSEEDKETLQSISSLAVKHLLAYAHESVQNLARVYNTTRAIQEKISMLKNSISEYQELMGDEKYDICDKDSDHESCYQCTKRICYSYISDHCEPDDLLPPSSIQISFVQTKDRSLSSSGTKLRYFEEVPDKPMETDVNTLFYLGAEKAKTMEGELEDKQKPIGRFSDLFADMQSNVVSFETNMLEELSETVLEPVAGFSEDAFEVGLETADTAFDGTATGAEVAFNKLKNWGESFHIDYEYEFFPLWNTLNHMDYNWFALPSFTDDWVFEDYFWGDFEETMHGIDMSDQMLEAGDTVVGFGSDAGHFIEDNFEEAVVEQPVKGAKSAWKDVKSGLSKFRWKRSLPELAPSFKGEVCKKFLKEGEWKFCESFQSDKQCQSRCKAEENKEFYCSQLIDHALKLKDFMTDLEAAIAIEQELVRSALQNHGWVAVLLKTMKFDLAARDDRKILLDWIEIDPKSFNKDKVWLFDDVTVGYSLKQSGSLYKMGNMKSKLPGPSNVLNIYDLEATKPLAQAIARDMNQTFFANEL